MNIAEYISSGILESYVLGMCNAAEAQDVERMLVKYPEIKQELDDIEAALNAYATAHGKDPGKALRDKILNSVELHKETPPLKVVYKADQQKAINPQVRYRILVAASVTLFGISLIGNILLYTRYKSANEQLISLNAEKNRLADEYNATQAKYSSAQIQMALMADPSVERIMLKGLPKSPESLAMIYWNRESGKVFLEVKELPTPVQGQQYQLWAIVDGRPVDAGMISVNPDDTSLHPMKDFASAQAFAITLEKEGGSSSPTMDAMIVLGQVSL